MKATTPAKQPPIKPIKVKELTPEKTLAADGLPKGREVDAVAAITFWGGGDFVMQTNDAR